MKRARPFFALCTLLMLLFAALASQNALGSNTANVPVIQDVFEPVTGEKRIFVTNASGQTIFVRVRLEEYLTPEAERTQDIPEEAWQIHIPAYGEQAGRCISTCGGAALHDLAAWTIGESVYTDVAAADGALTEGCWLYDCVDGWAYWSIPLGAGQETADLLERVSVSQWETACVYSVRGVMEWVTAGDLGQWLGLGAGSGSGVAQTAIASPDLLGYFQQYSRETGQVAWKDLIK